MTVWLSRLGFGALALLWVATAGAQKTNDGEVRPREPMRLRYPQTARDAGHQGTTELSATILPTGFLGDLKIIASSGSDLLDKAAQEASANWQFSAPASPNGAAKAPPIQFEVPFYKLPLVNAAPALKTFKCRDFVVDVAWFESTFPGKPRQDVRDYQAILAPILLRTMAGGGTPSLDAMLAGGKAIKAKRAALDAARITCQAAPDMLLIDAIAKAEMNNAPLEATTHP